MSVSITFNSAYRILLASEFFMARRPVLDREHRLVAHELLFCSVAADDSSCQIALDAEQPAAASVIEDVCKYGLTRVLGELPGILHVDRAALMSDSIKLLPPHRVTLEFAPHGEVGDAVLARISELAAAGYRFALAADRDTAGDERLLPLVEALRIDIGGVDEARLRQLCRDGRSHGKLMVADNVESAEQFRLCSELGFDYFRGYYFAAPQIPGGRTLSPTQHAVIELLALLASDADNALIEHSLKGDVSLGLNLLRLANTPAFGAHRVDSLRQALMVLGRNQLQCWLQVMMYAGTGADSQGLLALTSLATTRGRLMELIAQKLMPANRGIADTAFTVGVMSLMETLVSMPMEDILRQLPVSEEVAAALLHRQGLHGRLLTLVEHAEWRHKTDLLRPAIHAFKLSYNDLYLLQMSAFEWSDQVTYGMH